MSRILLVTQDKGGVGKSVIARALAEAVPEAPLMEIDASRRLTELEHRVQFFPMRADRATIERTGGRAARAEFDAVINAMTAATLPVIVDVGANTSASLLSVLTDIADDLKEAGVQLGVLVIVTAEPGALAEAPKLMTAAKPWAAARYLIENRIRGEVDDGQVTRIADGAEVKVLSEQVLEEKAVEIFQAGGFAIIPKLDPAKLSERHGIPLAGRIRRDLAGFRLAAMQAVEPAAKWLVGGEAAGTKGSDRARRR
jgi:hypothetical protein